MFCVLRVYFKICKLKKIIKITFLVPLENRYGKNLVEFKEESEAGLEDFEKYDDLMAWEFAQQGKDYWNKKLEELKSVL